MSTRVAISWSCEGLLKLELRFELDAFVANSTEFEEAAFVFFLGTGPLLELAPLLDLRLRLREPEGRELEGGLATDCSLWLSEGE
uniref:Uncharacterized protein n=1 Tax=Rodentolepis nana TaxID=102285 RepID=A0A0R3TW13_RODNA